MTDASGQENETTSLNERRASITYFTIHLGQLISGLLLLVIGILGFFVYPGGLIYLILPLPTYLWVSLFPLFFAIVFIVRSLLMAEHVSLTRESDVLHVQTKRVVSRRASFSHKDMRYIEIKHVESKILRWTAISILFITSYEIHFKNGIDLLGHASIAPFLLFCFVVVSAAIVIFIFTPRKYIEIGTEHEATFIPLPGSGQWGRAVADIARVIGFHEKTIAGLDGFGAARAIINQDLFNLMSGVAFMLVGSGLLVNASWFFGDFAVPAFILLGAKWIKDSLLGNKKFMKSGHPGEHIGCASGLIAKLILGGKSRDEHAIGASRIHTVEIACYFYLMAQAVKFGFRFAFWPYLGCNTGYLFLGLLVIIVIFTRWFGVVDQRVVDFGTFSISFDMVPTTEPCCFHRFHFTKTVRERTMRFAIAFSLIKGNKRLAWIGILFLLFFLVPILYYSFAYPPFIF